MSAPPPPRPAVPRGIETRGPRRRARRARLALPRALARPPHRPQAGPRSSTRSPTRRLPGPPAARPPPRRTLRARPRPPPLTRSSSAGGTRWAAHNLARPTLRVYAVVWNLPRPAARRPPRAARAHARAVVDELRAALERDGVGPAAIRKLLTMLQAVFRQAVDVGRGALQPAARGPQAARAAARSPSRALRARRGRGAARRTARRRGATLVSLLAYAGAAPRGGARALRRARRARPRC